MMRTHSTSRTLSLALETAEGGSGSFVSLPGSMVLPTWDFFIRYLVYIRGANNQAEQLISQLLATPDQHMQLAAQAVAGRNQLLATTRNLISPFSRALSVALKEEGALYGTMVNLYYERLENDQRALRQMRLRAALQQWRDATHPVVPGGHAIAIGAPAGPEGFLTLLRRHRARDISRRIIQASGRTNRNMNILSAVAGGLGITVFITAGVLTGIVHHDGVTIPRSIMDTVAFPDTHALVHSCTALVSGVASGYVARAVAPRIYSIDTPSWKKVAIVFSIDIGMLLLLGGLLFLIFSLTGY